MAWVKIDDAAPEHPKLLAVNSPAACWLWICGIAYCNRQKRRDGFIPHCKVSQLYPMANSNKLAARLVESGLWDKTDAGYVIHDYNQYQPTSEISEARSEAGRRGGLASGEARRNQETKQIASSKTNQNAEANEPPSRPVPSRPEEKDLSLIPTEQDVLEFDLDAVYEAYPRKKGKTPGMKIAQREIRTRADYAAFDAAVKSYAAEVTGRKPDHVLYFSTFMNQWRDYIPKGETSTQGAPAAETPLDRMTRENKEARRLEFFGDEK